jgi:hypothetical protein
VRTAPLLFGLLTCGLPLSTVACSSSSESASHDANASTSADTDASSPQRSTADAGTPDDAAIAATVSPGAIGPWSLTADYPLASNDCGGTAAFQICAQQTCVSSSGYVDCIGGASTSTYRSQLSSTGLGPWTRGADYPEPIQSESCAVGGNFIYCVGGRVSGGDGGLTTTADVYYAPLSSAGIGTWTATTPFPHAAIAPYCMIDSGYVYCVSYDPNAPTATPDAYFAPISSSGVGAWTQTAAPSTPTDACFAVGGYAYCFGGGGCPPDGPGGDCYSPSYFAPLTANGIGAWQATTQLPTAVSANAATAGSYIYYLSIPIFYASVSSDGIGPWQTTTNYPDSSSYPDSSYPSACTSSNGYLYCANQTAGASYFAQIGVPNPKALQLQNPPPFPRSQYLAPACNADGSVSVTTPSSGTVGAPLLQNDIDDAVVFDCASNAATAAGCTTTVTSPNEPSTCSYQMTIWYPCPSSASADTNCCYLPAVGYTQPFNAWCSSTGSNSFMISQEISLQPAQE